MADKSARDKIVDALMGTSNAWPSMQTLNPAFKDHMLALGIIITNYNKLEISFLLLFHHYLGEQATQAAHYIFDKLSNQTRIGAVKKYIDLEQDQLVKDKLEFLVSAYNTCTENRNFLAHAQLHRGGLTLLDLGADRLAPGQAVFKKSIRAAPERENFTHLSITDLQQIADDIERIDEFCYELVFFLHVRPRGGVFTFSDGRKKTPTLPETPVSPRVLILSDSEAPQGERPQPVS